MARKCASAHDRVTVAHYCTINHMFDNYTNINVGNRKAYCGKQHE